MRGTIENRCLICAFVRAMAGCVVLCEIWKKGAFIAFGGHVALSVLYIAINKHIDTDNTL